MRTPSMRQEDAATQRRWYVVDLEGEILGRAAARIAHVLRGKHKPMYTPHVDCGDFIVIVNADKVALSGRKWAQKTYYHHTGYPGGIKGITAEKLRDKKPEDIIIKAVRGMLPKGPLGRAVLKKLKVYTGPEHPHGPQKPVALDLETLLGGSRSKKAS